MVARKARAKRDEDGGGLYFSKPAADSHRFISTGSTLLDLVIGGGWPLGRMANIIGDSSTGKSLLAIEACANFLKKFTKGKVWYRETEAAFDQSYAEALGLKVDKVDFGADDKGWDTIEDIFEDLEKQVAYAIDKDIPGLYIIDSLDALSDRAEMKRKIDEGSYAMNKQKKLHQLFRQKVRDIKKSNVHLMIISQTKVKIGVMFGEKTTCTCDGSLQFYASQRLKLAKIKNIKRTVRGHDHVVGTRIRAKCTKNKIGLPHREAEFDIRFGFGINDAAANLEFLIGAGETDAAELNAAEAKKLLPFLEKLDKESHEEWAKPISDAVKKVWPKIQGQTLPTWKKY